MSEKQLQHERESSRQATNKIRKEIHEAKEKGYFSSTQFGRFFLGKFVPEFAIKLKETTSKTAWGKQRTTNIVFKSLTFILKKRAFIITCRGIEANSFQSPLSWISPE